MKREVKLEAADVRRGKVPGGPPPANCNRGADGVWRSISVRVVR